MDVLNKGVSQNPQYFKEPGHSKNMDSSCEPQVEYETLGIDDISSQVSSRNITTTVDKQKSFYKRKCKIILIAIIMVLTAALASAMGIFLSSKSQAKSSKMCPELLGEQHMFIVSSIERSIGDSIEVNCTQDNKLVGPSKIICLSSGEWSSKPKCEPRQCMPFKIPENSYLGSGVEKTDIGTELTIQCLSGFILEGNKTVTCLNNESWAISPACKAVDCGMPAKVRNGNIKDISRTTFNTSLQVLCNEGYALLSNVTTIVCNKNGLWDGLPDCRPISCGLPIIPVNGSLVSIEGLEYEAVAVVRCHEGFYLEGNMTIYCTQKSTWTPSPKCIFKDCGAPPNISNGIISGLTGTTFDSTFSVTCSEGYVPSGPAIVKCNSDGNWTFTPTCGPVWCGALTPPPNGRVIYINGTRATGASAQIICDDGYDFKGNEVAICLSSGNWSNFGSCSDLPMDCLDIRNRNVTTSGVYTVLLRKSQTVVQVFCDMKTDNGGWTVFQNRFNGLVDFFQIFWIYERGFGDLKGEFWLGLKYIHEMTIDSETELRIDLTAANGSTAYEVFQNFFLTSAPDFRLSMEFGTGTAGDGYSYQYGLSISKGWGFSTVDRDVDGASTNCALYHRGGWWYNNCYSNTGILNGVKEYFQYPVFSSQTLKTSKMMFRRI